MYKFEKECEVSGQANVNDIWNLYEEVSNWVLWDKSLKKVDLEGDFVDNTKGTMIFAMDNMPPLMFTLSDVFKNQRFVSTATLNGIEVATDHIIETQENGFCKIRHIVTVQGPIEEMVQGIGMGLTSKLELFMQNLMDIVSRDKNNV